MSNYPTLNSIFNNIVEDVNYNQFNNVGINISIKGKEYLFDMNKDKNKINIILDSYGHNMFLNRSRICEDDSVTYVVS